MATTWRYTHVAPFRWENVWALLIEYRRFFRRFCCGHFVCFFFNSVVCTEAFRTVVGVPPSCAGGHNTLFLPKHSSHVGRAQKNTVLCTGGDCDCWPTTFAGVHTFWRREERRDSRVPVYQAICQALAVLSNEVQVACLDAVGATTWRHGE